MTLLPDSALDARSIANRPEHQTHLLRIVRDKAELRQLPTNSDLFVGTRTPWSGVLVRFLLMVALSCGAVWMVTFHAWDHDNFFPWFWNPVWTIFPWVFLGPLWFAFFKSLQRKPKLDRFRQRYLQDKMRAMPEKGVFKKVVYMQNEGGSVNRAYFEIQLGSDTIIANQALHSDGALQVFELPGAGDEAWCFRFPDNWILVQALRRQSISEASATEDEGSLAEDLAMLAQLNASGKLTDEEYAQAKQKLLSK